MNKELTPLVRDGDITAQEIKDYFNKFGDTENTNIDVSDFCKNSRFAYNHSFAKNALDFLKTYNLISERNRTTVEDWLKGKVGCPLGSVNEDIVLSAPQKPGKEPDEPIPTPPKHVVVTGGLVYIGSLPYVVGGFKFSPIEGIFIRGLIMFSMGGAGVVVPDITKPIPSTISENNWTGGMITVGTELKVAESRNLGMNSAIALHVEGGLLGTSLNAEGKKLMPTGYSPPSDYVPAAYPNLSFVSLVGISGYLIAYGPFVGMTISGGAAAPLDGGKANFLGKLVASVGFTFK